MFELSGELVQTGGKVLLERSAGTTLRSWNFTLNATWNLSEPIVRSFALGIIFWPDFQLSCAGFELCASSTPSEMES